MDLTSIKDILEKDKSKIIIVENGKPSHVLLPIEEYRALLSSRDTIQNYQENKAASYENDRSNIDMSFEVERSGGNGVKLEDLPF